MTTIVEGLGKVGIMVCIHTMTEGYPSVRRLLGFGFAGQRGGPQYAGPYSTGVAGDQYSSFQRVWTTPLPAFYDYFRWRLGNKRKQLRGISSIYLNVQYRFLRKSLDSQGVFGGGILLENSGSIRPKTDTHIQSKL